MKELITVADFMNRYTYALDVLTCGTLKTKKKIPAWFSKKIPRKLKKELKKGFERVVYRPAPVLTDQGVYASVEVAYRTKAKRKTKAFHKLVLRANREQKQLFHYMTTGMLKQSPDQAL